MQDSKISKMQTLEWSSVIWMALLEASGVMKSADFLQESFQSNILIVKLFLLSLD